MRFQYANEAHAQLHEYQMWSGLEDLAQLLLLWLAGIALLFVASSWWFGRAKKRQFNFMMACLLAAMVLVQFVAIFHAAVRLPRQSRREFNLAPCLASTKGGKIHMYPPEGPYNDPPRRNPCCMGVLGKDLLCVSHDGNAHRGICRECATRQQIVTAANKNWTDPSKKTFVSDKFCDSDYGNPASGKYCGASGVPEWHALPCAGEVCSQCPQNGVAGARCYTRRANAPETSSLPWRLQVTNLGFMRDCMFGQHEHCTKAEPCSPCAVEDVLKYEPQSGNALPPSKRDIYSGRCRACTANYKGDCNFVEGVGPYCKIDAEGTKIEPCKKCCTDLPVYPFESTNGTCAGGVTDQTLPATPYP